MTNYYDYDDFEDEEHIDDLSDSVIDLCEQNKFDEADLVCQKLRDEHDYHVDGFRMQAIVYEYRGDENNALEYYKKSLDFMMKNEGYDCDRVEVKIKELKSKLNITG
jgi:hypothetical protein